MKKYILFLLPLILGLLIANNIEAKKKKYPNGDRYEGKWKDGAPNGNGKMIYANGDIYVGNWLSGNKHGEGEMTYTNGDRYEGEWEMGVKDGNGTMTYNNGDICSGHYSSGIPVSGILTRTNNDQCWFTFNHNSGNGTIKFKNGDIYEGALKELVPNGKGKLTNKSGFKKNGIWENGVLINGEEELEGKLGTYTRNIIEGRICDANKIKLKETSTYEGQIKEELPDGNGIFSNSECTLDGVWEKGKLTLLKKGFIKTNRFSHSITLEEGKLQILINYPNNIIEKKNYPNYEIDQLSTFINDAILYISNNNKKKKHAQEIKELNEYASNNLKNYRGENFEIDGSGNINYTFEDIEYQYYMTGYIPVKHGQFRCWNGKYHGWGRDNCSIKGEYEHGKKNGLWILELRDPGNSDFNQKPQTERLTVNCKNGSIDGCCILEVFDANGSLKLKNLAYYKEGKWNPKKEYQYITKAYTIETKLNYDEAGELHGNIYMKNGDVELKETYEHGKLIRSVRKNAKKGVVLTPKPYESNFDIMKKDIKIMLPIENEKYGTLPELFISIQR